ERFRLITENVADLIAVFAPDGRRVYHNPAYQELLGYAPDHPRPDVERFHQVHPEDRKRIRAIFADTLRAGTKHRIECRVLASDGAIHHVESHVSALRDESGRVVNVLVVARDITERKRSEARVRELAALVETAHDAIYVRDLSRHITYWSPGARRLYGWSADEVLGRSADELFYKADTPELLAIRQTVLEKGYWTGELRQFDKHDRELVVLARRTLLRDARGEPVSILNINTDVTELRRLEARLLSDQRMEIIGSLTGGIAHDLNNMLSPILMGAELLGLASLDERSRKTVEAISTSARHGTALVRQLMAFAKGNDGERIVVQIAPFLAEVEALLRQTLPRTITLSVSAAPDCWPVLADATQLKQILVNLCINSRDAMPGNGLVSIEADNILVDAALAREHPGASPGAHLRIRVSDTGSGIPPGVMARIFDPFFTTKAPGKGTGLGLSTVLGIVKGHGGFLEVESEPGRGTVFRLHFPMLKIEPDVAAPVPVTRPVASGRGETILVVDDDPGIRELMRALLTQQG
ncbi:MAG: PAS domain S-box protein, partial [Burkholderiales bacterium]|nr:PAS domain S-box protein [Opitutaceae bacterium]